MPQSVQLPPNSAFVKTPIYQVGDKVAFGLRRPVVPPADDDQLVEVTQGWEGRLDLLSADFYGTPELWWVLAEANQMIDPLGEVRLGAQIRVPRLDRVFNLLAV